MEEEEEEEEITLCSAKKQRTTEQLRKFCIKPMDPQHAPSCPHVAVTVRNPGAKCGVIAHRQSLG